MSTGEKIKLLSEALCNLVRAQEVVNNPAAAVKELLDNAIDAGATSISLDIKKGGKEYIHVTDNGSGMGPIDARMAFERHATSKLRTAEDLERIKTLGFRGEGLASIATIANVVLKTRRKEDELGTEIIMTGGQFAGQNAVVIPEGTSVRMSEVFFNVPGRRRSLKKDETEERAIDAEFTQCVLAHPDIKFSYYKGGTLYRELPRTSLKERIVAVAGRSINQKLLPVNYDSPNICVTGFISHPEDAVQRLQKQFFFVNGRFIKHDYFRKAVELAYENLIPQNSRPHFFLYFTVPTENVDINIHPSKKEVRFVDESYIWQLLKQLTREALSAHAAIPMIDWDNPSTIEIPAYKGDLGEVEELAPKTPKQDGYARRVFFGNVGGSTVTRRAETIANQPNSYNVDWGQLADGFQVSDAEIQDNMFEASSPLHALPLAHGVFQGTDYPTTGVLIYKGRYIVSSLKRSLALIDFHRAHFRILYDRLQKEFDYEHIETQELMFPEMVDLSIEEARGMDAILPHLETYGLVLTKLEEGIYQIKEVTTLISGGVGEVLHKLLDQCISSEDFSTEFIREQLILLYSEKLAYNYGAKLNPQQIDELLAQLYATMQSNVDPKGRIILSLIDEDDIEERFN